MIVKRLKGVASPPRSSTQPDQRSSLPLQQTADSMPELHMHTHSPAELSSQAA